MPAVRPRLSLLRIIEMNVGFFGLQFSFGLQQANMGPIYGFLGADEAHMPLLWLAGPMTGLLVQPAVGAFSDRNLGRHGRRVPYMAIGAIVTSLALLAMPFSPTIWAAASLMWILDAGGNMTLEPYRAFVADRLDTQQRPLGFMTQSAFTGLAQALSYLAPSLLGIVVDKQLLDGNGIPHIVRLAFVIGAVLSTATILYSLLRVRELPLSEAERAAIASARRDRAPPLGDIMLALAEMPKPMRRLATAMLFQWYAMFAYWQFIAFALARTLHHTTDTASAAFRDAVLTAQQLGALYNTIAFLAAIGMASMVRRLSVGPVHAACLAASGCAMLAVPGTASTLELAVLMIGIGLGWASMMGNNHEMLARFIPPERTGIYMGIFNVFVVIPMLVEVVTMPLMYRPVFGGDPRNVLLFSGLLMVVGAAATTRVREIEPA